VKTATLSSAATNFVAGGGRDLDIARAGEMPALAAGDHVRLVDPNGDEVGLAIADPDNAKLRVLALPADGFAAIDGALLGWRVEKAVAWRAQLGLPGAGHAYRIVHGAGDGLPGFAADVLGGFACVYVYGEGLRPLARQLADAIVGFARLDGAVVKLRARGGADDVPQETVGKTASSSPACQSCRTRSIPTVV
jgi:23S rRNA G2069 N7-methylase RlmK/C1962 C5-methylase RlmI